MMLTNDWQTYEDGECVGEVGLLSGLVALMVSALPGAAVAAPSPQLVDIAAASGLAITERTWSASTVD